MTSDFIEDLSVDNLKELLKAFRKLYRIQHGKLSRMSYDIDLLKSKIDNLEFKFKKMNDQLLQKESEIKYHMDRKLTFFERIKGKIKNENRPNKKD